MYEKKVLMEKKGLGIIAAVLAILGVLLRVFTLVRQDYFAWMRTAFAYGYPQEKILVVSLLLGTLVSVVGFILLAVAAFRGMPLFVPYIVVAVSGVIPFLRTLLIGGRIDAVSFLMLVLQIVGAVLAIVACMGTFALRYAAMGVFFAEGVLELVHLFVWQRPYFTAMVILYTVVPILVSAAAYGLAMLFSAPEAAARPPVPPYGYAPYGQVPPQYGQQPMYPQPPQYGQQPMYPQPPQYGQMPPRQPPANQ